MHNIIATPFSLRSSIAGSQSSEPPAAEQWRAVLLLNWRPVLQVENVTPAHPAASTTGTHAAPPASPSAKRSQPRQEARLDIPPVRWGLNE